MVLSSVSVGGTGRVFQWCCRSQESLFTILFELELVWASRVPLDKCFRARVPVLCLSQTERETEVFEWLPLQWLVIWDLFYTPYNSAQSFRPPPPPTHTHPPSPLLFFITKALTASVIFSDTSHMNWSDVLLLHLLIICSPYAHNM